VAVVATAFLIIAGTDHRSTITRIFCTRPFVTIGLLSYSLYLWHYPLLLFWRVNLGFKDVAGYIAVLALIFAAAVFSYRTIETKYRHSKLSFSKILLPALGAAVFAQGVFVLYFTQRWPGKLFAGAQQSWAEDWERYPSEPYFRDRIPISCALTDAAEPPKNVPRECFSNDDPHSKRVVFVVGDSHGFADWPMVSQGAEIGDFTFATLTHDGCWVGAELNAQSPSCRQYWSGMPDLIQATLQNGDSLFVAVLWQGRTLEDLRRAANRIASFGKAARTKGADVIVESPLPVFDRPPHLCTVEWFRTNYEGCSLNRLQVQSQRAAPMTELQRIIEEGSNVRLWDPLEQLCPADLCQAFRDGKPMFRDRNHLSYYGAKSLAPAFVRYLREDWSLAAETDRASRVGL